MKIEKIELFQISIPLSSAFSFGLVTQTHRDHVIAAITSEGVTGWGESGLLKWPYYNSETTETAFVLLKNLICPLIVGKEISHPAQMLSHLGPVLGNKMALAAVDFALWDLFAKINNAPLSMLLGGNAQKVAIGASFGMTETCQQLIDKLELAIAKGFQRVKFKISPDFPLSWIIQCREKNPAIIMSVDANSSFSSEQMAMLFDYDALNLAMIEQPFAPKDFAICSELQSRLITDICLDESIEDIEDMRTAFALKSARCVNIKPARVGGLTPALAIRDLCLSYGWKPWVGGLLETGIGRAHNLAFAASLNSSFPHDISECGRYGENELINERFELLPKGMLKIPKGEGIGVTVDKKKVLAFSVDSVTLS
jgi:O-succinylbenzoate synthase